MIDDVHEFVALIRDSLKSFQLIYISPLQDGCYPVLKEYPFAGSTVISIGVGNNILLDKALAKKDCNVLLFDHTVESFRLGKEFRKRVTFHKIGLAAQTRGKFMNMSSMLSFARDFAAGSVSLVKIDCEGCE